MNLTDFFQTNHERLTEFYKNFSAIPFFTKRPTRGIIKDTGVFVRQVTIERKQRHG